jgi:serine phosphatase RsbU (regulator of sigma subunit)/anti-sigma regulatory factor (Ser/Thr protein kinase)
MTTLPLHAHRTFEADERSVAKARAFAREMLEEWNAGDLADSVVLLVSELVTNAVVHAGTTARLELRLDTQSVRVEVEDLHPRRTLPMVVAQPTDDAEEGRGLLITFSLASAWGVDYTSGSKRVWLRFDRPVDQQATPRWSPQPGDTEGRVLVAVAQLSGVGVVTAWNDDAAALFGWPAAEVSGRHFDELLDRVPGNHDTDVPSLADMANGWQGTYSVLHKSDGPVPVFASHVGRERSRGSTVLMVRTDQRALIERPAARPGPPAPDPGFLGLMDEALVRLRLDDYLMLAVERVRDRLSADAAYLLMLRDLEDEYEVKAVSGLSATLLGLRLASGAAGAPDPRNPHLPVVVGNISKTPVTMLSGTGLSSLVLVPIAAENRVVGAIGVASSHVEGFSTDESVLLQQIANALAVATDRARLQALERERRGWLTFLAEAGDFLAGSLDQDMTMAITGQIVVPKIAQWCAVHLDDDRGHPVLQQVWHEDERQVEPLRADLEAGIAVVPAEPEDHEEPEKPAHPGIWGEVITVPLVARGRRIGHLSLGRPAGDPLRGEPLLVAESIARRAAIAIENARAHGELRAIGNALQRSLLPSSTPEAPGLDVGVVYEAAGEASTAGGDFYDLFPIGNGKSCFVVGDVCGTGPEAAAVTGLARHTIRALVLAGFPITDVLERLNRAIIDEGERSRFLTLVCGVLHPDGDAMRVEMVSAGHPLPVILREGGVVEQIGRPQSLLGVVDDVRYFEEYHRLSRGELFVAVTDGVLERRVGSLMLGEEGLEHELAATGTSLSAQAIAERIRRLVVEFAPEAPRDDMAVLVLRLGEAPGPPDPG